MKIFISILILLFCCGFNFATTCAIFSQLSDKEYSEKLQNINAIFYGEVVSISEPSDYQNEPRHSTQKLKIKVLQSWKGIETNEVTVLYTGTYTNFEEEIGNIGSSKYFYAYRQNDDSDLYVDFCSFSAFDDERMKRQLGEGKIFEESKNEVQTGENSDTFLSIIWQKVLSFFS